MSDLTGEKKCMQQKSFTYKFSCQIKVKVLWIVETDTQRTWTVNFADDLRLPTRFLTENKECTYVWKRSWKRLVSWIWPNFYFWQAQIYLDGPRGISILGEVRNVEI